MENLQDLHSLAPDRILSASDFSCNVLSGETLIALSMLPWKADDLPQKVPLVNDLRLDEHNDIYYQFSGRLVVPDRNVKVRVIHPATEKEIAKHTASTFKLVRETPSMYAGITKPYVEAIQPSRLQWVYNILDGTAEQDRVLLHNKDITRGFVLLPDFKWNDVTDIDHMYLLAIVQRKDIKSMRDLRGIEEHLALLRDLRDSSLAKISEVYGVGRDQLRVYVHYQPSFYHFHVHFVHVSNSLLAASMAVGRAHLLDDIIQNLEIASDYYEKVTISSVMSTKHDLYELLTAKSDS